MRATLTIIIACTFITSAFSQFVDGCDGSRYLIESFDDVQVTSDIKYGEGNLYPTEELQELYMDIYEPAGDEIESRPVVMLAFGGSFIDGDKSDLTWLCEAFAKRGYVAVSIDYRLFSGPLFPLPEATQMRNVVMRAVSDMKGAIRYLRQDVAMGNTYGIDPDQIFVGGISAGSILACHAAVLDLEDDLPQEIVEILDANGGLEGNTNDIENYSSEVAGLLNYSGGLNDASWIDENDPPFYSVHDENDNIVPFGTGFASVFGFPIIYMEGSEIMATRADSIGVYNEIKVYENSVSHVGYFFNGDATLDVINESSIFLNNLVCPEFAVATEDILTDRFTVFPNPTNGMVSVKTEGVAVERLVLINTVGQVVSESKNTSSINTSTLPHGTYYLQIYPTDHQVVTQKLIVH